MLTEERTEHPGDLVDGESVLGGDLGDFVGACADEKLGLGQRCGDGFTVCRLLAEVVQEREPVAAEDPGEERLKRLGKHGAGKHAVRVLALLEVRRSKLL